MAIAPVAYGAGTKNHTPFTSSFNSTGANLIVVALTTDSAWFGVTAANIVDNVGNRYYDAAAGQGSGAIREYQFYCLDPVTSATHVVSCTANCGASAIQAHAFSGVAGYAGQSNGAVGTASPISTGSVTPVSNGSLLFTSLGRSVASTDTAPTSFTTAITQNYTGGVNYQLSTAYYLQPTAGAINPAWTFTGAGNAATCLAVFEASGSTTARLTQVALEAATLSSDPVAAYLTQVALEIATVSNAVIPVYLTQVALELATRETPGWPLLASVSADPTSLDGGTSGTVDTTGAQTLVIGVAWWAGSGGTLAVSDSKGNTWVPRTAYGYGGAGVGCKHQFFLCLSPTVGPGHTFTVTGTGVNPTFTMLAFSGVYTFDTAGQSGTGYNSYPAGPQPTGSLTPSRNLALIIAGLGAADCGGTYTLAPAGFPFTRAPTYGINGFDEVLGYFIQTSIAAANPIWGWSGSHGQLAMSAVALIPAQPPLTVNVSETLTVTDTPATTAIRLRRIQSTGRVGGGSSTTITMTFPVPPSVGSGIVVAVLMYSSGAVTSAADISATDNQGNGAYSFAFAKHNVQAAVACLYLPKIVSTGTTFTITVTRTAGTYFEACAIEVANVGTGLELVQTSTRSGSDAAPLTSNTRAMLVDEVFVVAMESATTAQSSITVEAVSPAWFQELEQLVYANTTGEINSRTVPASIGTVQSCRWTISNGTNWSAGVAAFKAGTGAPPAPTPTAQLFAWRASANLLSGTGYVSPCSGRTWGTVSAENTHPWCVDGVFKNLKIRLASAPGTGKLYTFALIVNGAASALTFTISDLATEGVDITHTVAVVDGDTLSLRSIGTGGPTVSIAHVAIEFVPTVAGETGYAVASIGSPNTNSNRFCSMFNPQDGWSFVSGYENVMAFDGQVTKVRGRITTAPGATNSVSFKVVRNGVVQDGTGGTANTTLTFADTATTASLTYAMPFLAGESLYFAQNGTVNAPANPTGFFWAFKVIPTIPGDFQLSGSETDALDGTSSARFNDPNTNMLACDAVEANVRIKTSVTALRLFSAHSHTANIVGGGGVLVEPYVGGSAAAGFGHLHLDVAHWVNGEKAVPADSTLSFRFAGQGAGAYSRSFVYAMGLTAVPLPVAISPVLYVVVGETLTVVDVVEIGGVRAIDRADTITVTEAITVQLRSLLLQQARSEVFSVTDVATVQLVLGTQPAETLTITEQVAFSVWTMRRASAFETLTVTEGLTRVSHDALLVPPVETITVTEQAQGQLLLTVGIAVFDSIAVSDSRAAYTTPMVIRVSESVGVVDLSSMPLNMPAVYEEIRVREMVRVGSPVLIVQVHEAIAITEPEMNHGTVGIGPMPTPLPSATLYDFWIVGIV